MRMKMFYAESMPEAIRRVRDELGDNAIILSSQKSETGRGIRVTAAIDEEPLSELELTLPKVDQPLDALETIAEALDIHGTPTVLAERLLQAAAPLAEKLVRAASALAVDAPIMTMAAALDTTFRFSPMPAVQPGGRPIILVGPPGSGKTVTAAKLAARAVLGNRRINVITTDTMRAGGIDQLAAFTRILDIDLQTALDGETLRDAVTASQVANPSAVTLIDTAGANPYSAEEMEELGRILNSVDGDIVLVLSAGLDAEEAAETARAFAALGATRLLVTRMDAARRLGSVLLAADTAKLGFCDMSTTPHVADGLVQVNPLTLARHLLPEVPQQIQMWTAKAPHSAEKSPDSNTEAAPSAKPNAGLIARYAPVALIPEAAEAPSQSAFSSAASSLASQQVVVPDLGAEESPLPPVGDDDPSGTLNIPPLTGGTSINWAPSRNGASRNE